MIEVKIKYLKEKARTPSFETSGAACADLYAAEPMEVPVGATVIVPLGFAMELPRGTQAKVLGRSGLAAKKQIFVTTGTIDCDYRGEVGVILTNGINEVFSIHTGDRIAQLDVIEAPKTEFTLVESLNETTRLGGFGSTGV